MPQSRKSRWYIAGIAVITAVASVLALSPAAPSRAAATAAGRVTGHAAAGTPHFPARTARTEQVRQLVQCGGTMYAVGSFSTVQQGSRGFARRNIFSFRATPPFTMRPWNPSVNGTVDSIAFSGGNCASAYIGGQFSSVHGRAARNIAEISTSTGAVRTGFAHAASATVETLRAARGHILAGGFFRSINGSSADPYLASLSPRTGRDDGFVRLHISGHYVFPGADGNGTRVYNQSISHSGGFDLVMGDFTAVGGRARQQVFMLDLTGRRASVAGWRSPEWDGSRGNVPGGFPYQCATNEPFYIRAAAWSPDDSTVYIATTGFHPWNQPTGSFPRHGLCDAAAAFPAARRVVLHKWVNYTGCDSLYSAAADSATAYVAGHERWSQNPHGCDFAGPGAKDAPGLEGLSPATGALTFSPGRARGLGADDMLRTTAGLWIASDNFDDSQTCAGASNHAGICLLPS
ncbi:MAG TPA: hypothetical protein VGI64_14325 [Streptosporangiaceae bacterium]